MERTLQVMDYAVLVVSGSEGVQSHTQTLWKLLHHSHVPVFIFINKMDLARQSRAEILSELQVQICIKTVLISLNRMLISLNRLLPVTKHS